MEFISEVLEVALEIGSCSAHNCCCCHTVLQSFSLTKLFWSLFWWKSKRVNNQQLFSWLWDYSEHMLGAKKQPEILLSICILGPCFISTGRKSFPACMVLTRESEQRWRPAIYWQARAFPWLPYFHCRRHKAVYSAYWYEDCILVVRVHACTEIPVWAKSTFSCSFLFDYWEYDANVRVHLWSSFTSEKPYHQSTWYILLEVEMVMVGRSGIQMSCLCVSSVAEEKKSLKRTFQQIQEEEDDDYPGSYSPQDPSAGPLLVCGMGGEWEFWKPPPVWYHHKVELPTSKMFNGEVQLGVKATVWHGTDSFFMLKLPILSDFM